MSLIPASSITSDALHAERKRLEVITQNIAHAYTTSGPNGKPYQKQQPIFESVLDKKTGLNTVRLKVETDDTQGQKMYNPGDPHADAKGMVEMPNVKPFEELIAMNQSSRAYEAILSAAKAAESMAQKTLTIGR